jgi:hypothetical protein
VVQTVAKFADVSERSIWSVLADFMAMLRGPGVSTPLYLYLIVVMLSTKRRDLGFESHGRSRAVKTKASRRC